MLVYYNGQCYDKDTLLSHLNRVVEQIEKAGENVISEPSKRCLAKSNPHRNLAPSQGFPSNMNSSIHHCCEGNRHCCGDITSSHGSGITEICQHEECTNCHHHVHPSICHHHPDRKCITLRDKPKSQYTINEPSACCCYCTTKPCVFIPTVCKKSKVESEKLPCITLLEEKNDKNSVCEEKVEIFRANPFVIDEKRSKSKKSVVANVSPREYCKCKRKCDADSRNVLSINSCVCDRTNGLQDTCRICHKPRGRFGYLKIKK